MQRHPRGRAPRPTFARIIIFPGQIERLRIALAASEFAPIKQPHSTPACSSSWPIVPTHRFEHGRRFRRTTPRVAVFSTRLATKVTYEVGEPTVCFDVSSVRFWEVGPAMTNESYEQKLAELDDLINDPSMPFCPARIWQLTTEISGHVGQMTKTDRARRPMAAE